MKNLLKKMILDSTLPSQDKRIIINQITNMNPAELQAFLTGLSKVSTSKNPSNTFKKLTETNEQAHNTFMNETTLFLDDLRSSTKKSARKKAKTTYDTVLSQIDSLN